VQGVYFTYYIWEEIIEKNINNLTPAPLLNKEREKGRG
jgi:hypothetical protein